MVELLLKRNFWIIHLAFIGLMALLTARLGNAFIEAAIAPNIDTRLPASSTASIVVKAATQLNPELLSKLTGVELPKEPDVVAPSQQVVDLNAPPVKTNLRLKLLGTMVSESRERSMSLIQDMATLVAMTYSINDIVQGAQVLEIERERVIILNGNHREYIDATGGDGTGVYTPPMTTNMTAPPPPGPALGAGIKAVGDNTFEIPRGEIDKTLANLNDVAMQARIIPSFKDGVAQGFKIFSIRPDSIYTKIGIQNGDVIKRINGYDMNSPEKALEVYSKLKDASRIEVEVDRGGSNTKITGNIR